MEVTNASKRWGPMEIDGGGPRSTALRGGARLGRMGILGRLSTLIKSNVNDAIDSMQDPAKEIDQMIRDMEDSSRQARTEVAQCMASERLQRKRVDGLIAEARTWEEHAVRAVQAGDDALAKEAL